MEELIRKLKSVKLCLEAHPDNEPNSEFSDRIDDLTEIINELSPQQSDRACLWCGHQYPARYDFPYCGKCMEDSI